MWKHLLTICSLLGYCLGYRLLGFFPTTGKSQQLVFQPILHELAKRGHEVVYVTPIRPDFSHPNLEVRLIEPFIHIYDEFMDLEAKGTATILVQNLMMHQMSVDAADYMYGNRVVQELIHGNESFDSVLMESFMYQEPVSALIHKFNCPGIEVSTLGDYTWLNELSGLPDNPSYQIDYKAVTTDTMTFTERLHNTYVSLTGTLVGYYHLWRMQEVMDRYFNYTGWESRPPINKLVTNRSIILVNQDIALDYPYPLAPHVKRIGGVNIVPNKPLPKDIQSFMDKANDGVIYLSFGSNLRTSELVRRDSGNAFLSVFENIPQKIIMKWEEDEKIQLPNNVMTYKWIPQQDVLNHKNLRLFITHGGYLSLSEAAHYGVPILGVPFFADQPKNMIQIQNAGNGIMLLYENVTKESVSWAVNELLHNPRYKEEAIRRSQIIRSRRHTPLEDSMYWIDFAIKYPNFLTPRSASLGFFQLHMLDVKLFILLSLYILYRTLKYTCRILKFIISGKPVSTKKKTE